MSIKYHTGRQHFTAPFEIPHPFFDCAASNDIPVNRCSAIMTGDSEVTPSTASFSPLMIRHAENFPVAQPQNHVGIQDTPKRVNLQNQKLATPSIDSVVSSIPAQIHLFTQRLADGKYTGACARCSDYCRT